MRRSLDRAEERCVRLEKELHDELNKFGTTTFGRCMTLAQAYVERARERRGRRQATPEDDRILKKVNE